VRKNALMASPTSDTLRPRSARSCTLTAPVRNEGKTLPVVATMVAAITRRSATTSYTADSQTPAG
jgi:hypothetical protein